MSMKKKSSERGFTLIELGIVIAVIAVLATVVIVGVGFITTSKVSKATDAVDVIRKAASTISGAAGGEFPTASTTNEIAGLNVRGFLPVPVGGSWVVMPGLLITNVRWQPGGGVPVNNLVAISVQCLVGQCTDIWNSYVNDPNRVLVAGTTVGGIACDTAAVAPTAVAVNLCFVI